MVGREVPLHVPARVVGRARLQALPDPSRDGRKHEEDELCRVAVDKVQLETTVVHRPRGACSLHLSEGYGQADRRDEEEYGGQSLQKQRVEVVEPVADTVERQELDRVEGEER